MEPFFLSKVGDGFGCFLFSERLNFGDCDLKKKMFGWFSS